MDDAKVIAATGKALDDWFAILDERGARDLPHKDIARAAAGGLRRARLVEPERDRGVREAHRPPRDRPAAERRVRGHGDQDAAGHDGRGARQLAGAAPGGAAERAFDGVAFAGEPSTSRTEKWRYWRVTLADGSRVTVYFSAKPDGKGALIAVQHGKLARPAGRGPLEGVLEGVPAGVLSGARGPAEVRASPVAPAAAPAAT